MRVGPRLGGRPKRSRNTLRDAPPPPNRRRRWAPRFRAKRALRWASTGCSSMAVRPVAAFATAALGRGTGVLPPRRLTRRSVARTARAAHQRRGIADRHARCGAIAPHPRRGTGAGDRTSELPAASRAVTTADRTAPRCAPRASGGWRRAGEDEVSPSTRSVRGGDARCTTNAAGRIMGVRHRGWRAIPPCGTAGGQHQATGRSQPNAFPLSIIASVAEPPMAAIMPDPQRTPPAPAWRRARGPSPPQAVHPLLETRAERAVVLVVAADERGGDGTLADLHADLGDAVAIRSSIDGRRPGTMVTSRMPCRPSPIASARRRRRRTSASAGAGRAIAGGHAWPGETVPSTKFMIATGSRGTSRRHAGSPSMSRPAGSGFRAICFLV